jgi:peptidoglycan/xylan/chitin deacetylase (PgdA/CDA1 family)
MPTEPHADRFRTEVRLIDSCFNVLPLLEASRRLQEGTLPPRSACISFDDGYANNCEVAMPILRSIGVPATVFVATGFLDGGRMFNDTVIETVRRAGSDIDLHEIGMGRVKLGDAASRRALARRILSEVKYFSPAERQARIDRIAGAAHAELPRNLMLSRAQVRQLHDGGIEVGAHTVNHPILTSIDDNEAREQIGRSRRELEAIISAPVRGLAYPNGAPNRDYAHRHTLIARQCGFEYAMSTAYGSASRSTDVFQLPRVSPVGESPLEFGLRLARVYAARNPLLTST